MKLLQKVPELLKTDIKCWFVEDREVGRIKESRIALSSLIGK